MPEVVASPGWGTWDPEPEAVALGSSALGASGALVWFRQAIRDGDEAEKFVGRIQWGVVY